mmetsp:Transcript_24695/g.42538  ORF Transcript_24695/g.42538 Transcript_24695/m.42538 type:complete len:238 (+) Transcript_24695:901-1614(+)
MQALLRQVRLHIRLHLHQGYSLLHFRDDFDLDDVAVHAEEIEQVVASEALGYVVDNEYSLGALRTAHATHVSAHRPHLHVLAHVAAHIVTKTMAHVPAHKITKILAHGLPHALAHIRPEVAAHAAHAAMLHRGRRGTSHLRHQRVREALLLRHAAHPHGAHTHRHGIHSHHRVHRRHGQRISAKIAKVTHREPHLPHPGHHVHALLGHHSLKSTRESRVGSTAHHLRLRRDSCAVGE